VNEGAEAASRGKRLAVGTSQRRSTPSCKTVTACRPPAVTAARRMAHPVKGRPLDLPDCTFQTSHRFSRLTVRSQFASVLRLADDIPVLLPDWQRARSFVRLQRPTTGNRSVPSPPAATVRETQGIDGALVREGTQLLAPGRSQTRMVRSFSAVAARRPSGEKTHGGRFRLSSWRIEATSRSSAQIEQVRSFA